MAEVVRYVNYASTAGGDGTTNATSGANRAYATITECESAEQKNFVTAGDWLHVYVTSTGDITETVTISGSTTAENNAIVIEAAAGYEGTLITNAVSYGAVVTLTDPWTIFRGFSVTNTSASSGRGVTVNAGSGEALVLHCTLKSPNYIAFEDVSAGALIAFSTIKDSTTGINGVNWYTTTVISCTVGNCTTGITRGGTSGSPKMWVQDAVVYGSTTDYSTPLTDYFDTTNCSYNATDDTVTTGVPGSNAVANIVSGDFTNAAAGDYSLATGSALAESGVSIETKLSAFDRTIFTIPREDLAGNSLPQGSWPIGAYDLVSGGGGSLPVFHNSYASQGIV